MPQDQKNTESRTGSGLISNVRKAHQRLFGAGAKIAPGHQFAIPGREEARALDLRPRSASAGKDINLPVEKRTVTRSTDRKPTGRKVSR